MAAKNWRARGKDPVSAASNPSNEALLEHRRQPRERERDQEEDDHQAGENLEGVDLADPGRREEREALALRLRRLEQLDPADRGRERRVLDDVDDEADERREETPQRLRQDHRPVPADPAETECRRSLVLLTWDRLHRAPRRFGHLGASPEDERDRR